MADPFIHSDFLLSNPVGRRLYHEVAAEQPIIDYHCHLSPKDIAVNRRFKNLFEIWLEGDHYKWRAMRANGIPEKLITGDAAPKEKFLAWAKTVPMTYRNPLYHWTHLELSRYFGINELLDETTAESIWERGNARLAEPDFNVAGIFKRMKVEVVCTTDDPTDSLEYHQIAHQLPTKVLPTFRPDKGMAIQDVIAWNEWVELLATRTETPITTWPEFLAALKKRHDFFHELGGRLSDHGLSFCPALPATEEELEAIFHRARGRRPVTESEAEQFAAAVLLEVGRWNHARGWTWQLHLGALRNVNSRKLQTLGRDTGFDTIGDWSHAERLAWVLDQLERTDELPRTILYNLNPKDNYVFGAMVGNFNDGSIAGKIQFGSGWWFLDQKEGMEWQINALSHLGLLSRFVGMLTDSRSFLSYPRHEYFRRILCNLLGKDVEAGLIPNDFARLRDYVERICYRNAREYFQF